MALSVLITQCVQNDFVAPLDREARLRGFVAGAWIERRAAATP